MTTEADLLRAEAEAELNGVAVKLRLVGEPEPDGGLTGCVVLPELFPEEPVIAFEARVSGLRLVDMPVRDEEALARAFNASPHAVRRALSRLAFSMIFQLAERQRAAHEPARSPGPTVH
jgi:hypothetical protein